MLNKKHGNQTEDYTGFRELPYISFSDILLTTDKREIGLWLETVTGQPFLNKAMTFACCSFSGNILERKDSLIIWDKGEEICGEGILNDFMGILFGPNDLSASNTSITSDIS